MPRVSSPSRTSCFICPRATKDWRDRRTIEQLEHGTIAVVEGTLSGVRERPMPGARWRRLVTASLTDATGAQLRLVWFNLPSYMRGKMRDWRAYLNTSHGVQ
jgi:RecG-like helicase